MIAVDEPTVQDPSSHSPAGSSPPPSARLPQTRSRSGSRIATRNGPKVFTQGEVDHLVGQMMTMLESMANDDDDDEDAAVGGGGGGE